MHATVKAIAGLVAACTICAAPAALGATAKRPPGTNYVADTGNGAVSLLLSADHHQVRTAVFAYRQPCSDGDVLYDFDRYRAVPIGANRKFSSSFDTGPQADPTTPGATFAYSGTIDGMVNKAKTKIVGTARAKFAYTNPAGASYTCDSGPVKFQAKD